jgi:hypothetical protein
MVHDVTHIGGAARLASDPRAELDRQRRLTDPEEFADWLAAYESGRLLLVTLDVFADVEQHGLTTRVCDTTVSPLWFELPHGHDNIEHARDVVRSSVEELCGPLADAGAPTTPDALLALRVDVELDPELARRLAP